MAKCRIVVVGGGAAGFFAAIHCAQAAPSYAVTILERGPRFLSKVKISGGGRCNVTNACFDPPQLSTFYPRGGQALLGPFHSFGPAETAAWFEAQRVKLKTEKDGRIFPITNSSQTVIDCLLRAAATAGVVLRTNCGVERVSRNQGGEFCLELARGERLACDRLMLATGGCRAASAGDLAVSLGHTLEPPVPSLFTFNIETPWLRELAGISVENAHIAAPEWSLAERGPLLITHQGLSGPSVLRLSAWGARPLHQASYHFTVRVNWLPEVGETNLANQLKAIRQSQPARLVVNVPLPPLPARLWEKLVLASGISRETRWADLSNAAQHRLSQQLTRTELNVTGKTLNQDEFVTCGGVRLSEVNFKSMESRVRPDLYFGGELLDIDGLTGGFNFQAAWTTGWLAGRAMASGFGSETHDDVELGR